MTTATIAAINLQVYAQAQYDAARADGSYAAKRRADRKHFIWQGPFQTIPVGAQSDPAGFARGLRRALPLVNTLRMPFNLQSFNPDGSLDPRYEAFLSEAVRQHFRLIFVLMDGGAQRYGSTPQTKAAGAAEIRAALEGEILPRAKESFTRLLDWLDRHPPVRGATWGLELMNEPATFKRGMDRLPATDAAGRAGFVTLYAHEMVDLGRFVQARWSGRILVGGFAYSARFDMLAQAREGNRTALDIIRQGIGPALVWSSHLYPGWGTTGHVRGTRAMPDALQAQYGMLGGDDVLVTETNLNGSLVYNPFTKRQNQTWFAENYRWFANRGIGLTWFPGAQEGPSAFVTVGDGGQLTFDNLPSYAAGMNGFSLGLGKGAPTAPLRLVAQVIPGTVMLERTDPAHALHGQQKEAVSGIGLAVGQAGDDSIGGVPQADNLLYGGAGNDRLTGAGPRDFLYGQAGDDTLIAGPGQDFLFGGAGNDLLVATGAYDMLTGGPGGDRFSISPLSRVIVTDLAPEEGDTVDFRGSYKNLAEVLKRTSVADYNGDGVPDLIVWHGHGGYTVFLGMGARLADFAWSLAEFPASAPLPPAAGIGVIGGTPFSPATPIDLDGPPDLAPPVAPVGVILPGPGRTITVPSHTPAPVFGTSGNDRISGSTGDDVIVTGDGNDTVEETRGHNLVFAGAGDDRIATGRLSSRIVLGAGQDTVAVDMRNQPQTVWGGAGPDVIDLTEAPGRTEAVVYGFKPGVDRLTYRGAQIDLSLPMGEAPLPYRVMDYTRGRLVLFQGGGRLYLSDSASVAGYAAARAKAALPFDPKFDPTHPADHVTR